MLDKLYDLGTQYMHWYVRLYETYPGLMKAVIALDCLAIVALVGVLLWYGVPETIKIWKALKSK